MKIDGIIYILSIVIMQILFLIKSKTEKELNIFRSIGVSIVLIMCLNAFECYVLSFFGIPCSFTSIIIINTIFIFALAILMIIDKKRGKKVIQKYKLNKIDILGIIVILLATLIVSVLYFGIPFNIRYDSSDPSCHYLTSLKFMDEEKLLSTSTDKVYGNFRVRKFASYVNSGLLMRCFKGKIDYADNYIIFICFGIFILFLTGYTLYFLLCHFAKDDKSKILAMIVSTICILGYPLNSLLFGFEYMSLSLVIFIGIIESMYMFVKQNLKQSYFILILFLLNFGLFCAYFMFVPFVYPAEWIYLCIYSYKKDKKLFTKNNILILTVTLLIPFILGYIYHLAPEIYQIFIKKSIAKEHILDVSQNIINSGFNAYGYIYTNLYSNFILLLPLAIYIVVKKFKENKFISLLFLFNVLYIVILLIGRFFDKVSYYYLSKNYFTLWIIMFILNFRALMYIFEKHKLAPILIVIIYIGILIEYLIFVPTKIINESISTRENIFTVMDIFGANKDIITEYSDIALTNEEIDFIKKSLNQIEANDDVVLLANSRAQAWMYPLSNQFIENVMTQKSSGQPKINFAYIYLKDSIKRAKYLIVLKNQPEKMYLENNEMETYIHIYENNVGILLERPSN